MSYVKFPKFTTYATAWHTSPYVAAPFEHSTTDNALIRMIFFLFLLLSPRERSEIDQRGLL